MKHERKVNRKWAERWEAVEIIAKHPELSGIDALSLLFNAPSGSLQKEADTLQAGLIAQQEADIARMTAEMEKRKAAVAQTAQQETPADAQAAEIAAKADALAREIDARLNAGDSIAEMTEDGTLTNEGDGVLTIAEQHGKGKRRSA